MKEKFKSKNNLDVDAKIGVKRTRKLKRNIKDSIFTQLFKEKKYLLELYKCLHPEDKTVTESDIDIETLSTTIANDLQNDLSFTVRRRLFILLEDQSKWSVNVFPRGYMYFGESYKRYIKKNKLNIYGTKKIFLPRPEFYVIYTGKKDIKEGVYSFGKEFFGENPPADLKVTVIRKGKKGSILWQYFEFAHRFDDFRVNNDCYDEKEALKFIDKCIEDNILSEFLTERRNEVMSTMSLLFDQDEVDEMIENDIYNQGMEKGRVEGREEGREEGRFSTIVMLVKDGTLTKDEACKKFGTDKKKLEEVLALS